jgi:CHAT domain-containing protein/Tfp pilus assembly protein PilF
MSRFALGLLLTAFPIFVFSETLAAQSSRPGKTESPPPGIVVEEVGKFSEAAKAGLQEGDVLLAWSRADAKGEIESPFDLSAAETEQAPRGVVTLEGLRGTKRQTWILGPDTWGITVRPNFPQPVLELYRAGQEQAKADKSSMAAERWRAAAALSREQESRAALSKRQDLWLLFHTAELLAAGRQWKEADNSYEGCLRQAAGAGLVIETQLLRAWAGSFQQRRDWGNAQKYLLQAAALDKQAGPTTLGLAKSLHSIGLLYWVQGDLQNAEDYFQQALAIRQKTAPDSLVVAAGINNLGNIAFRKSDLVKAEEYYLQSMKIREKLAPEGMDLAGSLSNLGNLAHQRGDLGKAEEYYTRSLQIREKRAPDSSDTANSLNGLGLVQWQLGNLAKAEELQLKALAISQKQSPDGQEVAFSLNNLGNIANDAGDSAKAERYLLQAIAIKEKLVPDSADLATSLNNLGNVLYTSGDLTKAESYYQRALVIQEKVAPQSTDICYTWQNLGNIAGDRGDLKKDEEYQLRALALREKLLPDSLDVAGSLNNLGTIAEERNDLKQAEHYFLRALAIDQKLAPGSLQTAAVLGNLGVVASSRNDLQKAEEYLMQALAIREKLAPGSLIMADVLDTLGTVAQSRKDEAKAEEYYRRALVVEQQAAPGGLEDAATHFHLAVVALHRSDLDTAEQYFRQALKIEEKLAPGTAAHAEMLGGLAEVMGKKQHPETAAQLYEQALDALDSELARLGGAEEARSGFRARHLGLYSDYAGVLLQQKQPELAFQVIERSRARGLLETLAAAHVNIRKGVDPALLEQERSLRESIKAKSQRRLQILADTHTDEQLATADKEIKDLITRHQILEGQIRSASPAYAALTQPQPLTVQQIQQQLLDADTVLLEYSLGEERSFVWLVSSSSLAAYELPKRQEIELLARRAYSLLNARNAKPKTKSQSELEMRESWAKSDADYSRVAAQLSQMILGPVAALIEGKRLLVVSDGALQYIPFSALPAPETVNATVATAPRTRSSPARVRAPLAVEHEIVSLPSASVLAELRRQQGGHKEAPLAVVVLADPVFDRNDPRVATQASAAGLSGSAKAAAQSSSLSENSISGERLARSAADVGLDRNSDFHLTRLLYSRQEAEAIMAVSPAGARLKAVDFQATRALATDPVLAQYRIVHFATHGLLDSTHPELSGIVLSLVDKQGNPQDGFLELQDIYNLNLPAELVVLSACETGLGEEISGEGLVGLTRGFMYAGSSRVVASLWSVNDQATSQLMSWFYKALQIDKMRPAAALRSAQIQMWKRDRWKSPYYWAAFQIQGEWK